MTTGVSCDTFHLIVMFDFITAMGIMLVYDITNEKSFENIVKWLRNIDEHANEDVERMILGNKCDMVDKRVVAKERGEAVSIKFQSVVDYSPNKLFHKHCRSHANMESALWRHQQRQIST